MTVAVASKVHVTILECDVLWADFDDATLSSLDTAWTAAELDTLLAFDITVQRVTKAYKILRKAPRVFFPRLAMFSVQEEAILQLSRKIEFC